MLCSGRNHCRIWGGGQARGQCLCLTDEKAHTQRGAVSCAVRAFITRRGGTFISVPCLPGQSSFPVVCCLFHNSVPGNQSHSGKCWINPKVLLQTCLEISQASATVSYKEQTVNILGSAGIGHLLQLLGSAVGT